MFQKIKALFAAQRELERIQTQLDDYNLQFQTISREYREYRKRGYDDGYAQGLEIATTQDYDYISVERLRGMTLQELVDLIGEK
jgi:flagellar biosynthesis chaperone FliJ